MVELRFSSLQLQPNMSPALSNGIHAQIDRRRSKGRCKGIRAESSEKPSNKGWFYDKFVKDRTFDAKLARLKQATAEQNGKVGTLFDDSFKYTRWIEVFRVLTERQLESVPPEKAIEMAKNKKAVLLDVREAQDFARVHAEGAENVPLFQLITGNDLKSNIRRLGYALITDFAGTERNPAFVAMADEITGGDRSRPIIVICGRGGTLHTIVERKGKKFKDPDRLFGIQSRSLKACYELIAAGYKNVYHLEGGLNRWLHEDFDVTVAE